MSLLKVRVTAAEVVLGFKRVFMGQVLEANALPERHLYTDPEDATDEESETVEETGGADVNGMVEAVVVTQHHAQFGLAVMVVDDHIKVVSEPADHFRV